MLRTLLLVALCGLVSGAAAVNRFHERNHTGLLFLYAFDEGQHSVSPPSEVRDVSGRYLMGNLTTSTSGTVTWAADRQGMRIPNPSGGVRALTQLSSAALLPFLTDEFSLEFFISSPNNPLSSDLHIAGFGDLTPGAPFAGCDASSDSTVEGGWRLSSFLGTAIDFTSVLVINDAPECESVSIAVVANNLHHIVVRARNGRLAIVSHGNQFTVTATNPTFLPEVWGRNPSRLVLASPHPTTGWTGTIYMVAMYNRYLSNEEVAANRVLGPPNSVPYGAGAVEVDEDVNAPLVVASA
jgi:hypothetical protein